MTVQIFALKITGRNACGPQDKICSMFVSQKIHLPFSSHFFLTRAMCQKSLKIASSLQIDIKIHMAKKLCVNSKQKTCSTPVSQIRPFSYCSHPCSVKLSVCAIMFDCMHKVYWPQKYVLKKESLPFFFFFFERTFSNECHMISRSCTQSTLPETLHFLMVSRQPDVRQGVFSGTMLSLL